MEDDGESGEIPVERFNELRAQGYGLRAYIQDRANTRWAANWPAHGK